MMFVITLMLMVGAFHIFTRQEEKLRKQEISQFEMLQVQYDKGEISCEEYLFQLKRLQ
jgi:uncharacterized membrane protein